MVAVDDIILTHARTPYDPVKRREYYLRTRQLKGRKVGTTIPVAGRKSGSVKSSPKGDPRKAQKLRRAKRQREIDVKVNALRKRLFDLREILHTLVNQAKIRSGVKPTVKAPTQKRETAGSKRQTTATKKQTSTQKREAAKRSKEYYEKNVKGKPVKVKPDVEVVLLKSAIRDVEKKIEKARSDIEASIARARQKAVRTKPAVKSRQTSKKGSDQNGS
jgi:hypothetical protein